MSDQNEQLKAQLEKLHEELKRTQPSDDKQGQHLDIMQRDVQALLTRSGESSEADAASMTQGLRAGLQHFEATHPVLTGLIEQVLSTLSAAGI